MIKVEREFVGTEQMEEVLFSFLEYMIDKLVEDSYDESRTNVTPYDKRSGK